jgi:hypothetical protein
MPYRVIESVVVAPLAGVITASGFAYTAPQDDWISVLVGPASGLVVSLLVLWFLKGYYDRALTRESENRADIRAMLEKVVDLAAKQHELCERTTDVIEDSITQSRETNTLLKSVAQIIGHCHEKNRTPPS